MIPQLNIEKGWTEVIIDSNCEFQKFWKTACILEEHLNRNFTTKLSHFDVDYWDFSYKKSNLVLHYNTYLGISIFPQACQDATPADNEATIEIGTLLFHNLLDEDWISHDKGKSIGTKGSEEGTIISDAENINGARITVEKECGNIPFAITMGIYGLMFTTHYVGSLEEANDYVVQSKFKINKIFDLYNIKEDKRDDGWQQKIYAIMDDLEGITNTKKIDIKKEIPQNKFKEFIFNIWNKLKNADSA
jgi:hypothetical protein